MSVHSGAKVIHLGLKTLAEGEIIRRYAGLGFSETARRYAVRGLDEARAYLEHPVLGPRLVERADAVIAVQGRSAREIFGTPDDLKLRSCVTLFAEVSPEGSVSRRVLEVYFGGEADGRALRLMDR